MGRYPPRILFLLPNEFSVSMPRIDLHAYRQHLRLMRDQMPFSQRSDSILIGVTGVSQALPLGNEIPQLETPTVLTESMD